MKSLTGVLYGRIKAINTADMTFVITVTLPGGYSHDIKVWAEAHNMPEENYTGKRVRAMCHDTDDRHQLIDLEVVPEPALDDRQGMFAMSVYKRTANGVTKIEVSRGAIPADGDEKAFSKFVKKATNILGTINLDEED